MQEFLPYLLALHGAKDWGRAAQACGLSEVALRQAVQDAERAYGEPLVEAGTPFKAFTAQGEELMAKAREFAGAVDALKNCFAESRKKSAVAPLLKRRSVSPKRLARPGPDAADIDLMIESALHAPDHGSLHPWRVLVFAQEHRARLADLFEQEKLRRDPLAPRGDIERAREHATRSPALLAFVVSPRGRAKVPVREQWLAAGAALGNFMNAAHQLGFGGIVLSGERCFDAALGTELGLGATEFLAGFISLGRVAEAPPQRKPVVLDEVRSHWIPSKPVAVIATATVVAAELQPPQIF